MYTKYIIKQPFFFAAFFSSDALLIFIFQLHVHRNNFVVHNLFKCLFQLIVSDPTRFLQFILFDFVALLTYYYRQYFLAELKFKVLPLQVR